jgi:hypothetical protein
MNPHSIPLKTSGNQSLGARANQKKSEKRSVLRFLLFKPFCFICVNLHQSAGNLRIGLSSRPFFRQPLRF